MVNTRNGNNYSIQPDECGKGRGKTSARSGKSSSRKTCLEDATASPHSPRSVPTNFDVNSNPALIEGNILRAEPFPSGRNRNISVPIQNLVQRSKRRGVGNMPKPLAGGHELLLTHQELSGSGEDHRTLRRLEPIVLQMKSQKDKELVEEPKSSIHTPEERVENDPSFGDRGPSGVYQLQTSSRSVQGQAQRTSEGTERSQEPSRKGQRQRKLTQTLPTRVQDPQIEAFSSGQCLQYGQDSYLIHIQGEGEDEKNFSMQLKQEIQIVGSSINVELGKIDAKLTKITLDINDLNKNNKNSAELHKSTIAKLELISNTCDRIEIVNNTNQFAIHLARSDSERQKLKDEILAHVDKIHKNYEPNSHIPRHSTPLNEEKRSVKGSPKPFLGENAISTIDIPKLK
ncbi:hypothetical protein O181_109337 [Austropuccinia psidii MF-1]|uniref:Uncharacterized protein n=1 Tax=Austropuccinia psidii MF-1 TaxID=1389203 RepID=A0A9Q3JVY5_9BASI|nr:hypothetical protein [Austropuccinia psidii MF-1]